MKIIFSKSIVLFKFVFFFFNVMKCEDEDEGQLLNCWTDNVVPYDIDPNFSSDEKAHIHRVLDHIMNKTCLRWVNVFHNPKLQTALGIQIILFQRNVSAPDLCQFRRSDSIIDLGENCFQKGLVLHETMHTLGFYHEQQRVDRACYVEVDDNVELTDDPNFQMVPTPGLDTFPYDKRSVMHYHKSSILYSLSDPDEPLGSDKEELTDLDVWKLEFKFCRRHHYCDVYPSECRAIENLEDKKGCRSG